MKISLIPAFEDNYFFAVEIESMVMVVDPGSSEEVISYLNTNRMSLEAILITHHHYDHVDGVNKLKKRTGARVYGPDSLKSKGIDCDWVLKNEDDFSFKSINFKTLAVPGHTLDHLAYYNSEYGVLFCGDALFSFGCGRIFEGNPEMTYNSLRKFLTLPDETKVYCAHEYTLSNIEFSLDYLKTLYASAETINPYLSEKIRIHEARQCGKPTIPSTIGFEKKFNLFLGAKSLEEFVRVREARNHF